MQMLTVLSANVSMVSTNALLSMNPKGATVANCWCKESSWQTVNLSGRLISQGGGGEEGRDGTKVIMD